MLDCKRSASLLDVLLIFKLSKRAIFCITLIPSVGDLFANNSKPLSVSVTMVVACFAITVADLGDLSIIAISPIELPLVKRARIIFSLSLDRF